MGLGAFQFQYGGKNVRSGKRADRWKRPASPWEEKMAAIQAAPTLLVGQSFDCVFGLFVPRLTFRSMKELRVQASIGDGEIDEVVAVDVTDVRPNLYILSWTEQSGNFIVQLQDHENGVVHNYARLADGHLFCAQGVIQPVTS